MDNPLNGRSTDEHRHLSQKGGGRILAVLGPTNTGKTFLAVERMLAHRKGMIGFPLRLLARENYDKIARIKGAGQSDCAPSGNARSSTASPLEGCLRSWSKRARSRA